jgi:hypothetical protein
VPPLTTVNSGAIVGGGLSNLEREHLRMASAQHQAQQPRELRGKVLRAFYYQGKALEVGKEYDLPAKFAQEQLALKRFELVAAPAPKEPANDPAPEGKGKKGAK